MDVIRCRSHTLRSAQVYFFGTLAALTATFALSIYNRSQFSIGLTLLCLIGLVTVRDRLTPLAERWMTGQMGEGRVLSALRQLPETYSAITNFVVPGATRGDIDVVLIGPPGILAIEVKNYSGDIVFEGGRWWRRQKNGWKTRLKKSPSGQAKGHRTAILTFLENQSSRLDLPKGLSVPVIPAIVFVGADSLEVGSLRVAAMRVGKLTEFIANLPMVMSAEEVGALKKAFVSCGVAAR